MTLIQQEACRAIVNVFETGKVRGDYGAIAILKGDTGHLSYGRSQVTLGSGNLCRLLERYCQEPLAKFGDDIRPFLPDFRDRDVKLDNNERVKNLLRSAGREDPVMRNTQDRFFNENYLTPAFNAAQAIGLTLVLGKAVVYDSHIQGGWKIVSGRTGEVGARSEKEWVGLYIDKRREWLSKCKPPVPATVYRMDAFKGLVAEGNWNLNLPFRVHGVTITEESLAGGELPVAGGATRDLRLTTPYLRGDDVKAIQEALSAQQYQVTIDGVYGPYTDALVKMWQKAKSIAETGVGPETRKSLNLTGQAAKAVG